MHIYQKHILDELRAVPQARYSELMPDGVESSHFRYHLMELQKDGLVSQVSRGVYSLSDKGKSAVERLSEGRVNPHQTPKVITYTLLYDDDGYYLFRKHKEPYLNMLNMVAGKMHIDETPVGASVREVHEKLGVTIDTPELRAVANVRIRSDSQLITHITAYIFALPITGELPKLEYVKKSDIESRDDLAPDFMQLLNSLNENKNFHDIDLDITL